MPIGIYIRTKQAKINIGLASKGRISGKKNPKWKGGITMNNGYIMIYSPNHPYKTKQNRVPKHRIIIEKQINRYLKPYEKIHHINGIKTDNRPKNLIAFISESAHQRFHHNPHNVKPKEIIFDGRNLHA